MPVQRMKLDALHVTPLLQTRSGGVCKGTVGEYAAAAKAGAAFPPLIAFRVTDWSFKKPALVAGFHRHEAFGQAGIAECEVEVRDGTFAEAWLAGWLSNLSHGLRYSNADKRKATEMALLLYKGDSARAIAERINVSHDFVGKVRKELVAAGKLEASEAVKGKDGVPQPGKGKSNGGKSPVSSDDTGLKPSSERQAATPAPEEEPDGSGLFDGPPAHEAPPESVPFEPEPDDPADAAPEPPKGEPEPEPLKDGLGNAVPRALVDTFGDPMLAEAVARIDAAHRELISVQQHVLKTLSRKGDVWPYAHYGECAKSLADAADRLAEASRQLADGIPFCVCPHCRGEGCPECRQSGAWPRHRYDNRTQYGDAA